MQPDAAHMFHAVAMARRAWGQTAPNPAVGCVLVSATGQVLAAAHTQRGGRPHAETQALVLAGVHAAGATAYVTLEPCAHHGMTPPCAQALIEAGVARVVVACRDEDARMRGRGIAMLQQAGISVMQGVLEAVARPLYAGFFSRVQRGLPEISLKIATSQDGCIARAAGTQHWITGEQARAYGHLLRAEHEAILTGIGTALADDPELTCRLPGMAARSPLRAVMDSRLRLPPESRLVRTAQDVPLVIFTSEPALAQHAPYRAAGAEVEVLEAMTLEHAARALAGRGINRLLVEAGQRLSSHALMSGLIHRLYWFRAPGDIGAGGYPAFDERAWKALDSGFDCVRRLQLAADRLAVYEPPPTQP